MNCPEHLVFKALDDRVYLWMYWRDVPRERIPLRVWLNPLRYELLVRLPWRTVRINREGRWARKWNDAMFRLRAVFGSAQ